MKLEALTLEQCQQVRRWRNECLETLRTPYPLTEEMQTNFYRTVVIDPNASHRYFAIILEDSCFAGMAGLTDISLHNLSAEVSLILGPNYRSRGLGYHAANLIVEHGFGILNLDCIYGEVYTTNPIGVLFWKKFAKVHNARTANIPDRKRWDGKYYDSFYFSLRRDLWQS